MRAREAASRLELKTVRSHPEPAPRALPSASSRLRSRRLCARRGKGRNATRRFTGAFVLMRGQVFTSSHGGGKYRDGLPGQTTLPFSGSSWPLTSTPPHPHTRKTRVRTSRRLSSCFLPPKDMPFIFTYDMSWGDGGPHERTYHGCPPLVYRMSPHSLIGVTWVGTNTQGARVDFQVTRSVYSTLGPAPNFSATPSPGPSLTPRTRRRVDLGWAGPARSSDGPVCQLRALHRPLLRACRQ